jgi:hypothetical protein
MRFMIASTIINVATGALIRYWTASFS